MTDNTDLLDRMAISLVETWPVIDRAELIDAMNRVLNANHAEIGSQEIEAAIDRALAQKIDALLKCQWFYSYADGYFSLEAAVLVAKISAKLEAEDDEDHCASGHTV